VTTLFNVKNLSGLHGDQVRSLAEFDLHILYCRVQTLGLIIFANEGLKNVFAFICLSVSRITQNLVDEF